MRKYYMLNQFCELVYLGEYEDQLQAMQYVDSKGWEFHCLMDEGAAKSWLSRCKAAIQ